MHHTPALGRRHLLAAGAASALAFASRPAGAAGASPLALVASFTDPHQVTGVAVSSTGRIFVNFPRWEQDVSISVAEIGAGGQLTPYPNAAWNAYRDAAPLSPHDHFVCVQSVVVDPLGHLWVLDPAAPALQFEVAHGPKLVQIDLSTDTVMRIYPFPADVAPQGTYLNDIRFTPDGKRAVLTNSGHPGSLLTLDVASGAMRRVLAGLPLTRHDPGFVPTVHGHELRMADGQPATFNADSLAIDAAGTYAYWQASTGDTLRRVPVAALFDTSLTDAQLAQQVQILGETVPADGLLTARDGSMYFTSYTENAVRRMVGGKLVLAAQDPRLLWPDSMAEGPDGSIYVTASHIPQMKTFGGPGVKMTALFRFMPEA